MEKIIREAVQDVLSKYQSGDFCGCFEGDIDGVYPTTIKALENKLVSAILARLKREVDVANACHCGDDLFAINPDGNCAWCKSPRN